MSLEEVNCCNPCSALINLDLSKAKGYITLGIEDFGTFPVEAMSCGTPILFYKKGGVCESVEDGRTGTGIEELKMEGFQEGIERMNTKKIQHKHICGKGKHTIFRFI